MMQNYHVISAQNVQNRASAWQNRAKTTMSAPF